MYKVKKVILNDNTSFIHYKSAHNGRNKYNDFQIRLPRALCAPLREYTEHV